MAFDCCVIDACSGISWCLFSAIHDATRWNDEPFAKEQWIANHLYVACSRYVIPPLIPRFRLILYSWRAR